MGRSRGRIAIASMMLAGAITLPADAQQAPPTEPPAAQPGGRGVIAGQVLDKTTGRALAFANVVVVGTQLGSQSDLDGRFRVTAVPAGTHSVRAIRIGFAPSQIDSVRVIAGESSMLTFALGPVAQTLQSVQIEAGPARTSSEDALLALQKSAPRVSDGISAETIRRAPGSDAADAIVRVTGVSIVDKKFVVVRGLSERYSNTLLNGVELASPEPLKKIVPLDMFPSSLLESIVTNKTATPDRPGDFAGGSVEITTKEFPDTRVTEGSMSVGYSSVATFRDIALPRQRGMDYLGFDGGNRRQMPANPPASGSSERFAEQIRNVWTPAPVSARPDLGFGINLGGRFGSESSPFGYATALTYSNKTEYSPNRFNQLVFDKQTGVADRGYVANEATSAVDVGAIANFAARIGQTTKIGWKNLYTRNAEEVFSSNTGFELYNGNVERRIYQVRYVTRQLLQTQLTGDHLIAALHDSRLEWKGTFSASARDEPENRSLIYFKSAEGTFRQGTGTPGPYWFRFLDDRLTAGQLDWSTPVSLFSADALIKVGGLYRARARTFDADFYQMTLLGSGEEARTLPPEEAMAPENVGAAFSLERYDAYALPYESDDKVTAAYTMLDIPVTSRLRVIGGVRMEDWRLDLIQGTRESPIGDPTRKEARDYLWSVNATLSITDRQNIRIAGYRTVARPDPREVSRDFFVAVTGDCATKGNPLLVRTGIQNADLRWEYYPAPGELFSVSAFYKQFDRPIAEVVNYAGSGDCYALYSNVDNGRNLGAEVEMRKTLDFLPGFWQRVAVGMNVTLVQSNTDFHPIHGDSTVLKLPMQGQSDYLANINVLYSSESGGFQASFLANAFGDRVIRYGAASIGGTGVDQVPHVYEQGRITLDGKVQKRFGRGITASLSGRNLTDVETRQFQDSDVGRVETGYARPGISVSLGIGYAIR